MTRTFGLGAGGARRARLARYGGLAADLVKYAFASGAALALDFGVLMAAHKVAGLDYLVAAALGFLSGLALVYALSVRYVFSHRRASRPGVEILGFLLTGVFGLLLNQALMQFFVEGAGLAVALAKVPTAGMVFMFNFLARRALLFSPSAKEARKGAPSVS